MGIDSNLAGRRGCVKYWTSFRADLKTTAGKPPFDMAQGLRRRAGEKQIPRANLVLGMTTRRLGGEN
jgi:hypothetical protein